MTTGVNFLGIPIEGTIDNGSRRQPQRPREEFEPLVRALLDDPFIVEFGWEQYTPYFNDGDPCVFGASGFWVRTQDEPRPASGEESDGDEDEEDWEDEDDSERLAVGYHNHPTLGGREGYGDDTRYVGSREAQWQMCCAVDDAIDDGEFDDVLMGLFGDHARVTVRRTGIVIDSYEHD